MFDEFFFFFFFLRQEAKGHLIRQEALEERLR